MLAPNVVRGIDYAAVSGRTPTPSPLPCTHSPIRTDHNCSVELVHRCMRSRRDLSGDRSRVPRSVVIDHVNRPQRDLHSRDSLRFCHLLRRSSTFVRAHNPKGKRHLCKVSAVGYGDEAANCYRQLLKLLRDPEERDAHTFQCLRVRPGPRPTRADACSEPVRLSRIGQMCQRTLDSSSAKLTSQMTTAGRYGSSPRFAICNRINVRLFQRRDAHPHDEIEHFLGLVANIALHSPA